MKKNAFLLSFKTTGCSVNKRKMYRWSIIKNYSIGNSVIHRGGPIPAVLLNLLFTALLDLW